MFWLLKKHLWKLLLVWPNKKSPILPEKDDSWLKDVLTKRGVKLDLLSEESRECLKEDLAQHKKIGKNLIVTSTYDGKHMRGSKHYTNDAYDTRIWFLNKDQQYKIRNNLAMIMGSDYDILVEEDHGHREYDPK